MVTDRQMNKNIVNLTNADVARINQNLLLITLSLYSQDDETALHYAAYNNNVDLIRAIMDKTVLIDVKNKVSIIKTKTMAKLSLIQEGIFDIGSQHVTWS